MPNYEKDKEQKRKEWNKRKAEDVNKSKGFVFNPEAVVSREEGIKIYLKLRKSHAKTLGVKIPVEIKGKLYYVYPDGRIYKKIDLNNF